MQRFDQGPLGWVIYGLIVVAVFAVNIVIIDFLKKLKLRFGNDAKK